MTIQTQAFPHHHHHTAVSSSPHMMDNYHGPSNRVASREEAQEAEWNCEICTYLNKPLFLSCDMCGQPRSNSSAAYTEAPAAAVPSAIPCADQDPSLMTDAYNFLAQQPNNGPICTSATVEPTSNYHHGMDRVVPRGIPPASHRTSQQQHQQQHHHDSYVGDELLMETVGDMDRSDSYRARQSTPTTSESCANKSHNSFNTASYSTVTTAANSMLGSSLGDFSYQSYDRQQQRPSLTIPSPRRHNQSLRGVGGSRGSMNSHSSHGIDSSLSDSLGGSRGAPALSTHTRRRSFDTDPLAWSIQEEAGEDDGRNGERRRRCCEMTARPTNTTPNRALSTPVMRQRRATATEMDVPAKDPMAEFFPAAVAGQKCDDSKVKPTGLPATRKKSQDRAAMMENVKKSMSYMSIVRPGADIGAPAKPTFGAHTSRDMMMEHVQNKMPFNAPSPMANLEPGGIDNIGIDIDQPLARAGEKDDSKKKVKGVVKMLMAVKRLSKEDNN